MYLSAEGLAQERKDSQKLLGYSSCYDVGDRVRAFYPCFWDPDKKKWQLAAGRSFGYKVNDMKALGVKFTFIPARGTLNEKGEFIPAEDLTYVFSKFARLYIDGAKNLEIANAKAKFKDPEMLTDRLEAIKKDYDPTNMKGKRAVITGLKSIIFTEVAAIHMKDDDVIDFDNEKNGSYSLELSNAKIAELTALANNPQFGPTEDFPYLEVQYNYIAADGKKATAGKAAATPQGKDYRLVNLAGDSASKVHAIVSNLATAAESIVKRNLSCREQDERELNKVIKMYSIERSDDLKGVDGEDNYKIILNNSSFIEKLALSFDNPGFEEYKNQHVVEELTEAPTVDELTQAADENSADEFGDVLLEDNE